MAVRRIYSVRTDTGREVYWTTSRRKAYEWIAEYGDSSTVKPWDRPVAVYMAKPHRVKTKGETNA